MGRVLILGGTSEASLLARACADAGLDAVLSYAGRVDAPRAQPVETRIGGFGGAEGLADWMRANAITHLVDATHPFAARISANAVEAARLAGVPLAAFERPAWQPQPGDDWQTVPDMDAAVDALDGPPARVFLAIGRLNLEAFAHQPQHHYLLDLSTVGIGAGQMSRVDSARIAARKAMDATEAAGLAEPLTKGCVVASDAFFPFADGLLSAVEAGATAVIQPGGSMRDDEVIAAADEHGIAMVTTGMRHFRH